MNQLGAILQNGNLGAISMIWPSQSIVCPSVHPYLPPFIYPVALFFWRSRPLIALIRREGDEGMTNPTCLWLAQYYNIDCSISGRLTTLTGDDRQAGRRPRERPRRWCRSSKRSRTIRRSMARQWRTDSDYFLWMGYSPSVRMSLIRISIPFFLINQGALRPCGWMWVHK